MSNFAARVSVAPVTNVQTTVQPKQENAKVAAAVVKGLDEIRVTSVRVDGLALMKIIKHSREAHQVVPAPTGTSNATVSFSPAVGQLLGIDSNGVLEVSNVFALPSGSLGGSGDGEGETRGVRGATKYTAQLLPRLNDLKSDAALIGFYTSTNNGQHIAMSGFVDALLGAQANGGGIGGSTKAVPVGRAGAKAPSTVSTSSGTGNKSGKGIALVFDIASASQGYVGLKAFRLSSAFIETHRAGRFDTQSLIDHKLVPSNILEELPVTVHSSALLTAFLSTLVTPSSQSSPTSSFLSARSTPLSPATSFNSLSLPTGSSTPSPLSAPILALISALDTHQAHLSALSFQSRQLARDRARIDSNPAVIKRKAENDARAKEGLPLLPLTTFELEAGLVEPSRLETMCALAGVEGAARVLSELTGTAVVRTFGIQI